MMNGDRKHKDSMKFNEVGKTLDPAMRGALKRVGGLRVARFKNLSMGGGGAVSTKTTCEECTSGLSRIEL